MASFPASNLGDLHAVIVRPEMSWRPSGAPDWESAARYSCPVCRALKREDRRYAVSFVRDRSRSADYALALAEAMGFCGVHAGLIASNGNESGVLIEFFSQAIDAVLSILTDRRGNGERLEQIVFHAERGCPVCKHRERIVSATIGPQAEPHSGFDSESRGISGLCFPHFCATVNASGSGRLEDLAEAQLELMQWASGWLDVAEKSERAGPSSTADPGCEPMGMVLRVIAGARPQLPFPDDGKDSPWHSRKGADDTSNFLAAPEFCSVCAAISRTLTRRLESAERGARLGLSLPTVLPTCPDHLWFYARLASASVSLGAVRCALDATIVMLRNGIAALRRRRIMRAEEEKSVWYRRKNPSYFLGQDRKLITHLQRCQICEAVAVTCDRSVAEFVEGIKEREHSRRSHREYGLCMRHLAHACMICRGKVRDNLVSMHVERLLALRDRASETRSESSVRVRSTPGDAGEGFWRDALYRISGRM